MVVIDPPGAKGSTTVSRGRAKSPASVTFGENSNNKRQRPSLSLTRQITVDTSRARSNAGVVRTCIEKLGWKEYPDGRNDGKSCDIYWHAYVHQDMREIVTTGKVNKFPGMNELTKKISLTRAITIMQKLFPDQYDFYPRSWFIPAQLHQFYDDYYAVVRQYGGGRIPWFIAKPDGGAQGENIYLFHTPGELKNLHEPQLIQEYLAEPYLLQDKLKFDLRVYAVIKSINPLSVYIAREGMARFCTVQYRIPSATNSAQTFMHLTNYSLNKQNVDNFVLAKNVTEQAGSKRLLSSVFHQMEARGVNTRKVWHDIKLILTKTILAMVPELILFYENQYNGIFGPSCFQILGFDILLTKDLQPKLLEINACPSLSLGHEATDENNPVLESVVDEAIKVPLVRDTLLLVTNATNPSTVASNGNIVKSMGGERREQISGNKTAMSASSPKKRTSVDDTAIVKRSTLSEIFPAQYGHSCSSLLVLDRAAYLFLQFVHIRRNMHITLTGFRNMIRKCNLNDVIDAEEIETLYEKISRSWIGMHTTGMPFHGFVEILLILSTRKFNKAANMMEAFRTLLHYCELQMRYHGVRSARLKAETVEDGNAKYPVKEVYLLPNRTNAAKRNKSITLPKI